MIHEFLKDCCITSVSNAVAAGVTAANTSVLDMTGYDACCFVVKFNTVVDASVLTLSAYGNTTSSTSGGTAITTGVAGPFTASTSSNTVLVVDVIRPNLRYLFATVTRTAQNATIDSILAIQYRAHSLPVTQPATVIASAISSPLA